LLARARVPECETFWTDHPVAFVSVVLISVLAAGLVLEDFGSRIEGSIWDRWLKARVSTFDQDWHIYLRLQAHEEIVGQRYLRSILIRMKFELSMAPALIIHAIGLVWTNLGNSILDVYDLTVVVVILLALAAYLLWESWTSAQLLVELRKDVIAACAKRDALRESRPAT